MPRNSKKSKSKIKKAQSAPASPRKLNAYLKQQSGMPSALSRAQSSSSDIETDDSMSMCSELIVDVGEISTFELENEEQEILETMDDFDSLGESSQTLALTTIFNKLSHRLHEDFLSSKLDTFTNLLRATLTPTTSYKQLSVACKLASVIAISLPDDDRDSVVNDFLIPQLMDLIRHASNVGSEVAAIDALAFVCYFGGNADGLESTINLLNGIWISTSHDDTHPKIIDAALKGWTFLMSKLGDDMRVEFLHENMDTLRDLMKSTPDLNVRISSAECVSMYCDAWSTVSSELRRKYPIDLSVIRREFETISNETGRRRRNEMRTQKSRFKQFFKAVPKVVVDAGEDHHHHDGPHLASDADVQESAIHDRIHKWRPSIKLRFRSRVFEFEGWDRNIEYHRIKEMLASGTQTHMFMNPRLQAVFDLEDVIDEIELGAGESTRDKERKKRTFEDNARKAQNDIKRGRRDKFERLNHFEDNSIW